MATRNNRIKRFKKNGFSMVEVLIALLLLGIVGLGFLTVLANSSAHTLTADIRATAESIARSQMESIKSEDTYQINASLYSKIAPMPSGWDVTIESATNPAPSSGLQKVIVTVVFNGRNILTLEGYKSA